MINQGLSDSILGYFSSRNNDINGYWGVGILCKYCVDGKRKSCGVNLSKKKLATSQALKVSGFIINGGIQSLKRIIKDRSIENIRISLDFTKSDCNTFGYTDWYKCNISVLVVGDGKFGFSSKKEMCWPHNSLRERRRVLANESVENDYQL